MKKRISIDLTEDEFSELEKIAKKNKRNIKNQVEYIVTTLLIKGE